MKSPELKHVVLLRMANASPNIGEEAVLTVILSVLRPLCHKITVLDSHPQLVEFRHSVESLEPRLGSLAQVTSVLARADLVVWAGGHMVQDISSQWSVLGQLWSPILAKLLRCPILVFAVDIGPLRTHFGRLVSRFHFCHQLRPTDVVVVRNEESRALLTQLGMTAESVLLAPDPALMLSPSEDLSQRAALPVHWRNSEGLRIAIAPRSTFYMQSGLLPASLRLRVLPYGGRTRDQADRFERSLAATTDCIMEELDAQVLLVPMDTGVNPRDDLLCARIRSHVKKQHSISVLDYGGDLDRLIAALQEATLVVSGRFHGCVLGIVAGTGVLPIETGQEKVTRLMRSLGYEGPIPSIHEIAADPEGKRLSELIRTAVLAREQHRHGFAARLAELRNQWDSVVADGIVRPLRDMMSRCEEKRT